MGPERVVGWVRHELGSLGEEIGMALARRQLEGRRPSPAEDLLRRNQSLRQLVESFNHLTALALQDGEVRLVTSALSLRLDRPVAVLDLTLAPLADSAPKGVARDWDWAPSNPRLIAALAQISETARAIRIPTAGPGFPALVIAPIQVGDDVIAHLVTVGNDRTDDDETNLLLTEHAATVCAVIMSRQRIGRQFAERVKEDLVEGLLLRHTKDAHEARQWAEYLGFQSGKQHRLVTLSVEDSPSAAVGGQESIGLRRRLFQVAVQTIANRLPQAIVAARHAEVVAVIPDRIEALGHPPLTSSDLAEATVRQVAKIFPSVQVGAGISAAFEDAWDMAQAYTQANQAALAGRRLGRHDQVVSFDDLGVYRLLIQVKDPSELAQFVDETLGRLLEYERKHSSGLLRTLSSYLRHNGSLRHAANELHVHTNTVGYRLGRIQEIADLDLTDHKKRVAVEIALLIHDGLPRQ